MQQPEHTTRVEVSVIIPAYNASAFLAETIESVLAQSFAEFEVIVIDDGSTDDTLRLAQSYCRDTRVQCVSIKNSGVSAARNAGFARAKGSFVAFLDADDVWLPDNLLHKVNLLHTNTQAVLAHAPVENIEADSRRTGVINAGKSGRVLHELLSWKSTVVPGPSSILVRREAIEKVNGFDVQLSTAADQDIFFRLAELGEFVMHHEVLSLYRLHPNNMHRHIARMESDHIQVYRKAASRNAFGSEKFKRQCFAQLYLILAGSWWKNGGNKPRALRFMLKAVLVWPPSFMVLLRKFGR
ncbi:MAG: glycosyltransferase [Bacteroidia bacterium]|jgi:glycosyltransferase involved in cell wall biosynthesis|nr:glycosyltransferase [Bacteroidia bacterium]